MYESKTKSLPQKLSLLTMETVILLVAGWLLFFNGGEQLREWWEWEFTEGDPLRNMILFIMYVVVYVRMLVTIFHLMQRKMDWEEALSIPLAFAMYYIGYSLFALTTTAPLNGWDIGFIVLFVIGSYLNTFSELARKQWKADPAHQGKLYTEGLFKYSMHINYFGDLVWVMALALLTRSPWALVIPLVLFCFFAFYNIPMLDKYLAQKYGSQFEQYRRKTKKFIPFIY